jgi:hypothetical protein
VDVGDGFDVIGYWNGFGVGTDADERRLLRSIAGEWLGPGGTALITILSPWYWSREAGQIVQMPARPSDGYDTSLTQARDYDPVGNRFIERWWPTDAPDQVISQTFRCYAPADLPLLLKGTSLSLVVIEVGGQALSITDQHTIDSPMWGRGVHEYLAALRHAA